MLNTFTRIPKKISFSAPTLPTRNNIMKGCVQMVPEDASSIVVSNTIQIPIPEGGDVVIRVSHCGINHLDLIQADLGAKYKLPMGASEVLGLEVAGVILTVGEKCTRGECSIDLKI